MKTWITLPFFLLFAISLFAQEKGVTPVPAAAVAKAGATRAVVIGISNYQDPDIPDLRFADRDATAFAEYLRSAAGGNLDDSHLKLLLNERATTAQFAAALDWLLVQSKPGDQIIIYFSGHGDVETKTLNQMGFLLTWDTPARLYTAGAFSIYYLQEVIATLSVKNKCKVLLIADACRAGKLAGSDVQGTQTTTATLARQFANEVKILSCQPDEYSIEGEQWGGGRGVFSYHLIDGLYGLADANADAGVSLLEIGRYLEDHVTAEAAPHHQVPMVTGNKTERVATVVPALLAELRKFKSGELATFSPTEQKGLETDILESADSLTRALYLAFQTALREKRFFAPADACAEAYFGRLLAIPELAPLHDALRRNYAATLQDDAQQAVNALLKVNVQEVTRSNVEKVARYRDCPAQLARAAELLGPEHYLYATLKARELLFEGLYTFFANYASDDPESVSVALEKYRQSLRYQPDAPLAHYYISNCFALKLRQPDSAYAHTLAAAQLAQTWVLPYAHLAYQLCRYYQRYDQAKDLLDQAMKIDSNSVVVWTGWGAYHYYQYQYPAAIEAYQHLLSLDSTNALAYTNLAVAYVETQQYDKAEPVLLAAIRVNPRQFSSRYILGCLYVRTGRPQEAQTRYEEAIQINPTHEASRDSLARLYLAQNNPAAAEAQYLEITRYNPASASAWYALACLAAPAGRTDEALDFLKKALEAGSVDPELIRQDVRLEALRSTTGFQALMKKFFPDVFKD